MNPSFPLRSCLLLAALPLAAFAQPMADTTSSTEPDPFVRQVGEHEFTIGGSGATNKNFDNSLGGVSFSLGQYLTPTLEAVLRQSVSYSNPDRGGAEWNGATKLALDQHVLPHGPFRPFIGVNTGRIYGDSVRDTWAAGLEGGVKYYVQPRTFIATTVEYGWLFQHARGVEDRLDDGQWNWSVGVGFNF